MNNYRLFTALLAVAALAVPYGAADCVPTRSDVITTETVGAAVPLSEELTGATFYVVNDICQGSQENACLFSIWIYHEVNGVEGLQRGDEQFTDENCGAGPDAIDF